MVNIIPLGAIRHPEEREGEILYSNIPIGDPAFAKLQARFPSARFGTAAYDIFGQRIYVQSTLANQQFCPVFISEDEARAGGLDVATMRAWHQGLVNNNDLSETVNLSKPNMLEKYLLNRDHKT